MRDEFWDFKPQSAFLREAETYQSEHMKRDRLCALCIRRLGRQVFLSVGFHSARTRMVQNNCDDDQQFLEHARIVSAEPY